MKPIRKLGLKDAFAFGRILKMAKIKDNIDVLSESLKEEKSIEKGGLKIFVTLIESASSEQVEAMIYKFIASLSGRTEEAVSEASLDDIKEFISTLAEENNLNSFFDSALSALN